MAKSIRSKWKIKMRNVKRQKNYQLELKRLKDTVGVANMTNEDVVCMKEEAAACAATGEDASMDTSAPAKKYSKFLLDENGRYPDWLSKQEREKLKAKRLKKKPTAMKKKKLKNKKKSKTVF